MKAYSWLIIFPALILIFGFSPKEEEAQINWIGIEEAAALAEEDGKKILVDFYTDWCGWCKKMDRDTYTKAQIIEYINENYHAVKFDGEHKKDIVLKGKTFKFVPNGRRGYHELAASLMNGRMSYPTTVLLGSDLSKLTAIPGYKGPKELLPILAYIGDDAYKNQSWDNFSQEFKSR